MKKLIATGTAFAFAFGLSACEPAADGDDAAAVVEADETVEEVATDDAAMDGTMAVDAGAEEGADEGTDSTGPDHDGNPVHD